MSYTIIQSLLDTQLQTVTGSVYVQLENTRYEPKTGTPFIRPAFMPVESQRLTHERDLAQGIYSVDIFYPADKGTAAASTMADAVKAAFARGLVLTSGSVIVHIAMSYRLPAKTSDQFYGCPVIVKWVVDSAR